MSQIWEKARLLTRTITGVRAKQHCGVKTGVFGRIGQINLEEAGTRSRVEHDSGAVLTCTALDGAVPNIGRLTSIRAIGIGISVATEKIATPAPDDVISALASGLSSAVWLTTMVSAGGETWLCAGCVAKTTIVWVAAKVYAVTVAHAIR